MSFRAHFYNEGGWYYPTPIHRQMVVPGQSMEIDLQFQMEAPAFTKRILGGGQWVVASFYVPFRLLWDGWVDFVAAGQFYTTTVIPQTAASPSVPRTSQSWPLIFEANLSAGTAGEANVFARRAYKLIQNEYFGQSEVPSSVYADIEDDVDVPALGKPARNIDQFVSAMQKTVDLTSYSKEYTVTSSKVTIDLNDLRALLQRAKSTKRATMTGDKYVDAMGRMGVKLDWRVQNAPELLGIARGDLNNRKVTAANSGIYDGTTVTDTLGQKATEWFAEGSLRTGRRFFAEHGMVLTVLVLKPLLFNAQGKGSPDANTAVYGQFWMGDNTVGTHNVATSWIEPDPGTASGFNFTYLTHGRSVMGRRSTAPWCAQDNVTDLDEVMYPSGFSESRVDSGLASTTAFAVVSSVNNRMTMPFGLKML